MQGSYMQPPGAPMPGSPPPGAPFGGPPGGAPPGGVDAKAALSTPGLLLMIAGGLGMLEGLYYLAMAVLTLLAWMSGADGAIVSAATNIVMTLAFFAGSGFVLYAGMQARAVKNYNLVLAGSIFALIPCCTCCLLGLPGGIMTLMAITKPEIKAQFS